MGKTMLLAAIALIALVALPPQAQAASAGFCVFGICAGVDAVAPTGAVIVRVCNNVASGCNTQVVPHGAPNPPVPIVIGCTVVNTNAPPFPPGLPAGSPVVSVCV